jgi:hypothetical protein
LLDSVSLSVTPTFMLQTLFVILLTTPSSRMAALHYLGRRLPKPGKDDCTFCCSGDSRGKLTMRLAAAIVPVVGSDPGLLARGYASAVQDDQILVQRATLDAILSSLPIDGRGLRQYVPVFYPSSPVEPNGQSEIRGRKKGYIS